MIDAPTKENMSVQGRVGAGWGEGRDHVHNY